MTSISAGHLYRHAALKLGVVVEADLERSTMASRGRSSGVSVSVTVESCAVAKCRLRNDLKTHKEVQHTSALQAMLTLNSKIVGRWYLDRPNRMLVEFALWSRYFLSHQRQLEFSRKGLLKQNPIYLPLLLPFLATPYLDLIPG